MNRWRKAAERKAADKYSARLNGAASALSRLASPSAAAQAAALLV